MTIRDETRIDRARARVPVPREQASPDRDAVTNGVAAAAIVAAGVGCAALGVLIVLAESIGAVKTALTFSGPVGPLSGKTLVASAVWLIAWVALHLAWRRRQVAFGAAWAVTLALITLGLLGTFPPFYQLFVHE